MLGGGENLPIMHPAKPEKSGSACVIAHARMRIGVLPQLGGETQKLYLFSRHLRHGQIKLWKNSVIIIVRDASTRAPPPRSVFNCRGAEKIFMPTDQESERFDDVRARGARWRAGGRNSSMTALLHAPAHAIPAATAPRSHCQPCSLLAISAPSE